MGQQGSLHPHLPAGIPSSESLLQDQSPDGTGTGGTDQGRQGAGADTGSLPFQPSPSSSSQGCARQLPEAQPDLTNPSCSAPDRCPRRCQPGASQPHAQEKPGQPRLPPLSLPGSWEGVIGEAGD